MHMHMESQNELVIAGHVRRHDEEGSGAATVTVAYGPRSWATRPRRLPASNARANQPVCLLAILARTAPGAREYRI